LSLFLPKILLRRQNQSPRLIVGDLAAGEVLYSQTGGLVLRSSLVERLFPPFLPPSAATRLAWSGDPSTRAAPGTIPSFPCRWLKIPALRGVVPQPNPVPSMVGFDLIRLLPGRAVPV
ncbi:hypothetical protein EJB05_06551, partial [Eragrostis curvula]